MYFHASQCFYILIATAVAIPLLPDNQDGHSITIDQADNLTSNVSPFDDGWSPLGPADLDTRFVQNSKALDPQACLELALRVLVQQATDEGWNRRLPSHFKGWSDGGKVQIRTRSFDTQPMMQRYAVWTIVRMIDTLVRWNSYAETAAEMKLGGDLIGIIWLEAIRPPTITSGQNDSMISSPDTDHPSGTGTEVAADDLAFRSVQFYGAPNSMSDVYMAAIIAVVRVFEKFPRGSATVRTFVARWRDSPYRLNVAWWSKDNPSRLNQRAILTLSAAAVELASSRKNYRCFRAVGLNNGQYVGEGGFLLYPPSTASEHGELGL